MMMESLEVNHYHLHEIIFAINTYADEKYENSNASNRFRRSLENAALKAKKLYESTQST